MTGYENFVDFIQKHPEGFTLDMDTGQSLENIDGYVVGGVVEQLICKSDLDIDDYRKFFAWFMARPYDVRYVGSWLYEGKYYFDACDILLDRQEALDLAKNRGQLAIWNGYENREEYVEQKTGT